MRQFNTKLFAILLGSTAAAGVGLFAVHWLQTGRIAQGLLYQARRAEEQGQLDQTARYLGRYLEFSPADLEERAHLGRILGTAALDPDKPPSAKARQRALFVLEQVVAQDAARADLRLMLVKVAMLDGHADVALKHLKELPEGAETLDLAGQCHAAEGRLGDAATAFWKATQADPKQVKTFARLAALLKRPDAAGASLPVKTPAAVLDLMVEKNADDAPARVIRWRFRPAAGDRDAKQLEAAGKDVTEALRLAPDDADVLLSAGELAQAEAANAAERAGGGDEAATAERDAAFGRAREYLDKGVKLHGKDPRFYLARAAVEVAARKPDAAQAALDAGLKALPGQFDLLWTQANLLLDDNPDEARLTKARAVLEQMRKGRGTTVAADYLEARLALLAGQWREAGRKLESVRIALDKDQLLPGLLNQVDLYLARCYEQTDEPGLRREALDRVVKRTETADPAATALTASRRDLAEALVAQGRYDEAIQQLTRAASASGAPKSAWLDVARLMITRKMALRQVHGEWKDVEDVLLKAGLETPEPYLLEARVMVFRGKGEEAEKRLIDVREHFPKAVEPWLALASLYDVQNNAAKALETLDAAEKDVGDGLELRLARARHWSQQPKEQAGPELKRLAEGVAKFEREDDRVALLRGLVEANYRAGLSAEALRLWGQLATMPRFQNDVRVRQVQFDLAIEVRDWPAVDASLKEIQRIEGAGGPMGTYAQALKLMRQAESQSQPPPQEARELLERVAAARPKWTAVQLARAELELKAKNLGQAVLRLREAADSGEGRNPRVVHQLVAVLRQMGRNDEANKELSKLPPEALDADLQWLGADLALRNQDPALAVKRAMSAVPADSKDYMDYLRLGVVFAADGRKQEAERNLRQAIKLAPKQTEPYVALCRFLLAAGRRDDAKACQAEAEAQLSPEDRPLTLARCAEAFGDADVARKLYGEALRARPDHVPTLKAVVNFQIRSGRPAEAEPLLRAVVDGRVKAADEDKTWARRGLALVRAVGGDFRSFAEALAFVGLRYDVRAGAITEVDRPAGGFPVEERRVQAQALATQPQKAFRAKAIECLLDVEKAGALAEDDRHLLAQLYEADGSVSKAREQWLALVAGKSPNPSYLAEYAQHLLRSQQLNECQGVVAQLEEAEKARQAPAGSFGSVELRAQLLELRGEGDRALELLKAHVNRQGARPEEVFALVSCLARQRKTADALALCDAAWEKCPPEMVSGASVAVLRSAGRTTDAQFDRVQSRIEEASAKEPQKTILLLNLADLYDLRGDYPKAVGAYRQVLERDAKNYVAMNNLAWLLAQTSGDGQEALRLIGRAIEDRGERPELLDTRATVLLTQKQARQAIVDLERANAEARTEARSFHLAQAYYLANDRAGAAKALREAQQAGLRPERLHPIEQKALQQLLNELKPQ